MNKITILGSGTSTGVPILGCNCQVCQSNDLRNYRLRSSVLLQTAKRKNILIDASPDLRAQLLKARINHMDAVIITHDHADHTHGMDDLRPFTFNGQNIKVHTDSLTGESLKRKFPYIFDREKMFKNKPIIGGGIPQLDLEKIDTGKQVIQGEEFEFYSFSHGYGFTLGVRHGHLAYLTDCHEIPEATLNSLEKDKLEILILDCLRFKPHETHLHLDLSLEYIKKINPKLAILTHLGHDFDYLDLISQLERRGIKYVFPAIDNQSFFYS